MSSTQPHPEQPHDGPPHVESRHSLSARFDELVESRKEWITHVLQPWCKHAPLKELQKAAAEWGDIAGRVDPESTLWAWAWCRFPALVNDGMGGIDETHPVRVVLHDHRTAVGFPDRRASPRGSLLLVPLRDTDESQQLLGPFSLDEVASVTRLEL